MRLVAPLALPAMRGTALQTVFFVCSMCSVIPHTHDFVLHPTYVFAIVLWHGYMICEGQLGPLLAARV